jgi:hypothetical protein
MMPAGMEFTAKSATRLTSSDSVSCLASALHASFGLWIDDIDMIHWF